MEQLEGALQRAETGQDLCSSRRLQTRHHQLEGESQALAGKLAALVSQARQVVSAQPVVEETQKSLQRYLPASCISTSLGCTLLWEQEGGFTP